MPASTPDLFYVLDQRPADTGTRSTVRDLIAMPCRGTREVGEVVAFIDDGDCAEDLAAHQLGALRWNDRGGVVSMLYVRPPMRRRGVATALWRTAARLHTQRTGAPLTVGSGRTVLGQVWMRGLGMDAPLSRLILPMTPADHTQGVERRKLVPDDALTTAIAIASRYRIPLREVMACCEPTVEAALAYREGRHR